MMVYPDCKVLLFSKITLPPSPKSSLNCCYALSLDFLGVLCVSLLRCSMLIGVVEALFLFRA